MTLKLSGKKTRRVFSKPTRSKRIRPKIKKSNFPRSKGLKSYHVKNYGVVPTFHHVTLGSDKTPFAKMMRKQYSGAAPNMLNRITPFQQSLGANVQSYFSVGVYTVNDMASAQGLLGTSLGGTGAQNNTARTFYQDYQCQLMMTNSNSAPIYVDLYVLKCKRDTSVLPTTAWQDGLKDEVGSSGTDYTLSVGTTPLQSKYLTVLYDCKQIIHVTLAAGQVHQENFTYHKNCSINNEIISNISGNTALGGWTVYILGVIRGTPMSGSGGSLVATCGANLDCVFNETYCIKQVVDQKINYLYNPVSSFATATNIYNQGSGASAIPVAI